MRTAVTVTRARRGSFAARRSSVGQLRLDQVRDTFGAPLRHRASVVEELELLLAELGELQIVDEAYDLAQAACRRAPGRHRPGSRRASARCQRSWSSHSAIETLNVFWTRALIVAEHAALALERVVLGQQELETEHADHHRRRPLGPRPSARRPARPSPATARAGGPPARPRTPRSTSPDLDVLIALERRCRTRSRSRPRARRP